MGAGCGSGLTRSQHRLRNLRFYGVLALRDHIKLELSAMNGRNARIGPLRWHSSCAIGSWPTRSTRSGGEGLLSRAQWRELMMSAPGMESFRRTMFSRLVPNLREIGLLSPRIQPHYDRVGLMRYFDGAAANLLTGEQMIQELDSKAA